MLEDCELFLTLAKRESFAYIDAVHAIVSYQGDNLTGSLDLVSDHALARRKAVLEYCHWKLGLAENGDDERVLQAEAAREAYLLALGHATRSESIAARRFYAAAFRHRRSWAAAKGFIATTLPPTFYRRLSALRSRYTQFRRTSTADG